MVAAPDGISFDDEPKAAALHLQSSEQARDVRALEAVECPAYDLVTEAERDRRCGRCPRSIKCPAIQPHDRTCTHVGRDVEKRRNANREIRVDVDEVEGICLRRPALRQRGRGYR